MGYLVFGLLLIVVTVCAGEICEPDEIKLDGKEMCICSSDGSYWDCAVRDNPGSSSWSPRNRRSATDKDHCEPGTSFKEYCNTCVCPEDGNKRLAACTRILCDPAEWNQDGTPRIYNESVVRVFLERPEESEERCQPGKSFKLYCNNCGCPSDGLVSRAPCTMMWCDPEEWFRNGTRKYPYDNSFELSSDELEAINEEYCQPGTTFKKYCNTCKCGTNGLKSKAACSKILCDYAEWNEDGTSKLDERYEYEVIDGTGNEERCVPGSTFKKYCNTCKCGANGLASRAKCGQDFCDRGYWAKDGTPKVEFEFVPMSRRKRSNVVVCQPRRVFKNDCNTCVCSDDGRKSVCTLVDCPVRKDKVEDPRVCEPGKRFKVDCNDCTCSDDGLRVWCTDMACSSSQ